MSFNLDGIHFSIFVFFSDTGTFKAYRPVVLQNGLKFGFSWLGLGVVFWGGRWMMLILQSPSAGRSRMAGVWNPTGGFQTHIWCLDWEAGVLRSCRAEPHTQAPSSGLGFPTVRGSLRALSEGSSQPGRDWKAVCDLASLTHMLLIDLVGDLPRFKGRGHRHHSWLGRMSKNL